MELIQSQKQLQLFLKQQEKGNNSLGFVPTMGALHEGHISLISKSVSENDRTICSIFVNPEQFNNANDLNAYPRTPDADIEMLDKAGCTAVWMPTVKDIYPSKSRTGIHFGELEMVMEGAFRPGHFSGVGLILAKFFNLLRPDRTYMGLKDLQQFLIVRQLIQDLNFTGLLISCPTVREADGLAMSSRNRRLTNSQRLNATVVIETLKLVHNNLGNSRFEQAVVKGIQYFNEHTDARLEYLEIASLPYLQPVTNSISTDQIAICIAAWFGEVRLIDNIILSKAADGWNIADAIM